MTILVTGGAGFLGSVVVRQLLARGDSVVVLDRFDYGVQPLAAVWGPRLSIIRGSIEAPGVVRRAVEGCDTIIHLAGIVGYPACDRQPIDAAASNIEGTERVVRAAQGRVIFASSASVYGAQDQICTEDTPLAPLSSYARQKVVGEAIVLQHAHGVVLRLATLFGPSPRMRWDLLPHDFARTAVRDHRLEIYQPDAVRPFVHVEDAAAAFVWATTALHVEGEVFNIADPESTCTKRELGERLAILTDSAVTIGGGQDPDQRTYAVSAEKIQRAGWGASASLTDALPGIVQLARVWEGR